jgi:ketosteroid isomerase-like protein
MVKATLDDVQTLEELNRGYVQAAQASDLGWFDKHLASCFMSSNPDGSLADRAGFLERIGRPHPLANMAPVDSRVRVVGGLGIVDSGFRCTLPDGTGGAGHYTDVYARLDGRWQCVSAHFALRPAPSQTGAARTAAVSAGVASPTDHGALADLNHHYIRAVRESDVAWFDANLAPEFVNVNADGSFSDRAAFLAFIAKPSAARNLRAEDVRIQVVGDAGIIHARTAYTKPDGEPGAGRYTDVWWRAGGRWSCVSAHVTRG